MKKFIDLIKQKWLKDTLFTTILVIILIAIFIFINLGVNKLNINPMDITKEKLYTLSDESKSQVKDIDQDVHIYFFGYEDSDSTIILAKQYNEVNKKITAEAIKIKERPDLSEKYGIEDDTSKGIVVESPSRYKVLTSSDFVTYDTTTYETIDITEQKLTNAIIDTTVSRKPHIYFLTGHNEEGITDDLITINAYIQNEINDVSSLDLLQSNIPDDCDTLVIASPSKDFEELEANKILEYINKGGNILWLGQPTIVDVDFPNMKKIMDTFGFSISKGMIAEDDSSKIILQNPFFIIPNITYHEITKDLSTGAGVALAGTGKINIESQGKLESLGVTVNTLMTSSDNSYYIEDYTASSISKTDQNVGPFTLGAEFIKKVTDNTNSKLIVFSNCNFVTDKTASENSQVKLVNIYNNKDLVLNSIAYLTDRGDTIRIRKDKGLVTYTATQKQDNIVKIIIFALPILIIIFGIVVWQIRRRKK